jgi:hypothetical protein
MQMQHKTATRQTIPFLITNLPCHLLQINAMLQEEEEMLMTESSVIITPFTGEQKNLGQWTNLKSRQEKLTKKL